LIWKTHQTGEIKMTKYLVFKNQPDSGKVNAPGSWEEMASEIANIVSQDRMPPNYYIAFPTDNPNASMESLKQFARFSLEITDETAEIWANEIQEIVQKAHLVEDALNEASGAVYQAILDYNKAIEGSNNFKDLTTLSIKALDRMFEYFEVESSHEVPTRLEDIFSVELFDEQY
jgi:hypothetical protein